MNKEDLELIRRELFFMVPIQKESKKNIVTLML